ncbi:MAG: toll/interleukin-1 receptor domain-containing protein [Oscillospiraceae bacterium]|nr:toll/interleukin-1 receptor domain-containing protein [Oscillospiraceae bacterium]
MIILVTKHLLDHGGSELEALLRMWNEAKWVPILPIGAFTKEDYPAYKRYFGATQLVRYEEPIKRTLPDGTDYIEANRYTRELVSFIRSVSLDRKQLDAIRSAFKQHVFISYRKKDYEHLKQLKRQIQSEPECRDMALWSDDFLFPGENYNQEIGEAIRVCSVFILLVTPNVLEMIETPDQLKRPNYVAEIEYPVAKSYQKPILPIEMAPVNEEALKNLYPEIPACVNVTDKASWLEALVTLTHSQPGADGKVQTDSAEEDNAHYDYLMGLAYLKGIFVEADLDKAATLLMRSADEGNLQAVEELGTRYRREFLKADSKDTLWKVYEYQLRAVDELLKKRELSPDEGPKGVEQLPLTETIKLLFTNAYFCLEQCTKPENRSSSVSALASDITRLKEFCTTILRYRDYYSRSDSFQEPLYSQINEVVGYEKYYSKTEKTWKVGKPIRQPKWHQTGSVRDPANPRLLHDALVRRGELLDELANKSPAASAAKCRESAQSLRDLAASLSRGFGPFVL